MLMNLTDPDLQGARGSRRVLYSRWPYPWPSYRRILVTEGIRRRRFELAI
jgi:hypothetical protein